MEQIKKGAKSISKTITWEVTTTEQHLTQVTTQIRYMLKHKTGILPVCQTTVGYHSHLWSQPWKNIHPLVMVHPDQLPSLWLTQISHHLLHDQTPKNQQMCDKTIKKHCGHSSQKLKWKSLLFLFLHCHFQQNNTNIVVFKQDM